MGADSTVLTTTDPISTKVTRCRICKKEDLLIYLPLGYLPLANNLFRTQRQAEESPVFPLSVAVCGNCHLSQLTTTVSPKVLFSHYVYRSAMSKTYIEHCKQLAKWLKSKNHLTPGGSANFVIDIAGNDGTLLKAFKELIPSLRVLNIDPATNLCNIARESGVESWPKFWDVGTAMEVFLTHGQAAVITATNVFAHVDDVRGFLLACRAILQHNGILVLEFPYLLETIERNSFGQVYFEHLSYMLVKPLKQLVEETGLKMLSVENFPIHDGTIRVIIASDKSNHPEEPSVSEFIAKESTAGLHEVETYLKWGQTIMKHIDEISFMVKDLTRAGKTVAAFGASAKGNTLLNSCGLTTLDIQYIVDDTPEKQDMFSPGTGIPIKPVATLAENKPDYLLILAWNFEKEILERLKGIYTGKIIIPVPQIQIYDYVFATT